jgi:hypothetical protein
MAGKWARTNRPCLTFPLLPPFVSSILADATLNKECERMHEALPTPPKGKGK